MTLLSVTLALTATAQTAGGGISEQMMQQMERQYAAQMPLLRMPLTI